MVLASMRWDLVLALHLARVEPQQVLYVVVNDCEVVGGLAAERA